LEAIVEALQRYSNAQARQIPIRPQLQAFPELTEKVPAIDEGHAQGSENTIVMSSDMSVSTGEESGEIMEDVARKNIEGTNLRTSNDSNEANSTLQQRQSPSSAEEADRMLCLFLKAVSSAEHRQDSWGVEGRLERGFYELTGGFDKENFAVYRSCAYELGMIECGRRDLNSPGNPVTICGIEEAKDRLLRLTQEGRSKLYCWGKYAPNYAALAHGTAAVADSKGPCNPPVSKLVRQSRWDLAPAPLTEAQPQHSRANATESALALFLLVTYRNSEEIWVEHDEIEKAFYTRLGRRDKKAFGGVVIKAHRNGLLETGNRYRHGGETRIVSGGCSAPAGGIDCYLRLTKDGREVST
jgi:hypothetical protein